MAVCEAIANFSLNEEETELKDLEDLVFGLIKPQLIANNQRFKNGKSEKKTEAKQKQTASENEVKQKQDVSETEANNNNNNNENNNVNVFNKNEQFQIKTENFLSLEEYIDYREYEFNKLDEEFIIALSQKVGISNPYCWCNRRNPQGYFDLVDCLIRVREDVEWRSSVQRNNNISKEKLLLMLYDFVKEIKDSKVYLGYDGYDSSDGKENFIAHFTRWLKLKLVK